MPIDYDTSLYELWNGCYKSKKRYYQNNGSYKEARCSFCVLAHVQREAAYDQQQILAGRLATARTEEEILAQALEANPPPPGIQIFASRPDNAYRHVSQCYNASDADRREAARQLRDRVCERAARKLDTENVPRVPNPSGIVATPFLNAAAAIATARPAHIAGAASAHRTAALTPQSSVSSVASSSSGDRATFGDISNTSGPYDRPAQRRRVQDILPDGPTTSATPSEATVTLPTPSLANSHVLPPTQTGLPLSAEVAPVMRPAQLNAEFASDLCRLMIVCNIAWWAVEIPFFLAFVRKWIPGVVVPGRQQLSGRILDEEATKVTDAVRSSVHGKHATGACDGWKNVKRDALVASTANVEGNAILLNVSDISGKPKTAETLFDLVLGEIKYMIETLYLIVVAWCTDASGESAKMRRMLCKKYPWLVVLDCWAHQVQLVVCDMFRLKTPLIRVIDEAIEVVKWFNNHSLPLGRFRDEQRRRTGRVYALILPGTTRWTSHFLCVKRLLDVEASLRSLVADPAVRDLLIRAGGKKREAKDKAREVLRSIQRPSFWENLRYLLDLLRPLAIASNVTQGDNARLDTVLITLANLYRLFSLDSVDPAVRSAVLNSLEKRWRNADQPIFILAVVFNPYIRTKAFHPQSGYTAVAGLYELVADAYRRFFGEAPNFEMRTAFSEYVNWKGEWSSAGMGLADWLEEARKAHRSVNLVKVWEFHNSPGVTNGRNGLVLLAMRILSMVPNSAATERCFSIFRAIHTDHRNRMDPEKVRKMTLIGADVEAKYGAPPRPRMKRKFGDDDGEHGAFAFTPEIRPSPPPSRPPTVLADSIQSDSEDELFDGMTVQINASPDSHGALSEGVDGMDTMDMEEDISMSSLVNNTVTPDIDRDDGDASDDEFINNPSNRTLARLFHYPAFSSASPDSIGYLTEFWTAGEGGLCAEESFYSACGEEILKERAEMNLGVAEGSL